MTEPMKGLAEWLRAQATEREKHEAHQIFPHGADILRHWAAELEASRLPLAGAATSDEDELTRLRRDGPIMRRGSRGDGSDWMGTMRECLEDAREAAQVEARWRREAVASASPAPSDAAVQQPVAWMHVCGSWQEVSERQLDDDERARGWTQFPLYEHPATSPLPTAPAARMPLSDEQIVTLAGRFEVGERNSNHWGFAWHDFARAIEAEHGITLAQKGDVK